MQESDISDVLTSSSVDGDVEKAYDLITLLQESKDGIIKPYDRDVKLLGAVNREGVTCYLDSLLFAMFARQSCFEAMLYNNFTKENTEKLATLIRLWVNMLRVGKLITTDMVRGSWLLATECICSSRDRQSSYSPSSLSADGNKRLSYHNKTLLKRFLS